MGPRLENLTKILRLGGLDLHAFCTGDGQARRAGLFSWENGILQKIQVCSRKIRCFTETRHFTNGTSRIGPGKTGVLQKKQIFYRKRYGLTGNPGPDDLPTPCF